MDFFGQLGPLALGSRLRRLTERIGQDVAQVYKEQDIDFEPRWFPVFYLLTRQSPLGIMDIAKMLGVSHPAVNQIAGEMIRRGLIQADKCRRDGRKRLLVLTEKGEAMRPALQEIWDDVEMAARDLLDATGTDVIGVIEKLESALDEQGVHARFVARRKARQLEAVEIVDYRPEYKPYFKTLNEEWIRRYFRIEPEDTKVLGNPEREILDKGGHILFARSRDEILGTCALIPRGEGLYELSKMAVTERAQGKQIGKKLMVASIEKAKALRAGTVYLETNSRLNAAINLYRKMGFELVPRDGGGASKYERADMYMRLEL